MPCLKYDALPSGWKANSLDKIQTKIQTLPRECSATRIDMKTQFEKCDALEPDHHCDACLDGVACQQTVVIA